MFFNGFLQRKLNSLLRPWLTQDPQFQVNLGFFRSIIVAKNLNFDTSILNTLIDSGDELNFLFKSFTIDEVYVRIAHWSSPAFTLEFNGVNVTLFLEKRTRKRVEKSVGDYLHEQKRRIVAEIDSAGSMLHDKIENMIMAASLKSQLKDSLKNLLLTNCFLQFNEVRIRVEYPFSDDKHSWLCYSKKLNARSSNKDLGCLLGGIISLVFLPLREVSFDIETSKLEIGAEKKNYNSCILSCVNPYFGISIKDSHIVNSCLSIQEMSFSFSPSQLQMIGAFNNLLNIECNHVRSGKLLWGIARWKIRHSLLPPGRNFYKVARIALLWIRLVKEYQYFLLLAGYSKNEVKIPNNHNVSRLAEQQWKMISQTIETKLPAQVIASARRVARQKAVLQELDVVLSPINSVSDNLWRIFMPLVFVWWAIVKIFEIIRTLFFLRKSSLEVVDHRCCFLLGLGKISVMISCMDDSFPSVHINSNSRKKTSQNDLVSFFLLVKGFLLIYEDGISEQNISFTLGFLEVSSLPMFEDSDNDYTPKYVDGSFVGTLKDRPEGSEAILSGEPALLCSHCEGGESGFKIPILEQLSEEMDMNWKSMLLKFQGRRGIYDGSPLAVCVIHTYRVYPGVKISDSGFSKYCLMIGKLHLLLKYSSIRSISTLREQFERAFSSRTFEESQDINVLARNRIQPNTFDEQEKDQDSIGLKSIMKKMRMNILNLLPDKHVEVKAIVAGPCVEISLSNEKLLSSNLKPNAQYYQNGVDLFIDVENIEFTIWPTGKSGERPEGFESELFKLKEPMVEGISESFNIKYASKGQVAHFCYLKFGGLSVHFEDSVDNHSMQVLLLKPMNAKFSSLRNYVYSFARSTIVSSLSLQVVFLGITGSLYMDELSVILQVVGGLFSLASMPATNSAYYAVQNNTLISENQSECTGPPSHEMLVEVNNEVDSNSESPLCFVSANFEFTTFDIILHKSRNDIDRRRISMLFDAYNTRNLGLTELPNNGIWVSIQKTCLDISFGEPKSEANVNFHKCGVTMFDYKNQYGNNEIEFENEVIPHSVDCLHEVSLSTCRINLLIDEDNASSSLPRNMLLFSVGFDEVFFGTCGIKNGLSLTHSEDKLHFSLAVGREFESVTIEIQGGRIFMEVKILARFEHCCISYLEFMKRLLTMDYPNRKSNKTVENGSNVLGKEHIEGSAQIKTPKSSYEELLNAFSIKLSQLSIVLLMTDESRVVKEFIGRVNLNLNLWSENSKKKFLFNIHNLDILSRTLIEGTRHSERDIRIPRFSSQGSLNNEVLQRENTTLCSNNTSCSSSLDSISSPFDNSSLSPIVQKIDSFENYILERLAISILAEKSISRVENGLYCSRQGWAGNGSVSGLNLTISLSEMQMLFATVESLPGVSNSDASNDAEEKSSASVNQQSEKHLEEALPDGAIVAIQDVHQHMYIAVESVENKYKLGGTIHYSLAGKKALFRVKWHKRGILNFASSWFSLLSLEAKSDSGIPLRLNYMGSSGFVDISNTGDNSRALWKLVSNNHEFYEDEVDLDPLNRLSESTFYLINKKNDSGIAFNRGVLEFVEKPGNSFKFKIFHGLIMDPDVDDQDISEEVVIVPSISLTIEKFSLTLVHELTEPKDKLPLFQLSVDPTDVIVQILPHKSRVMSTLKSMLYYFDVHRFIWREFVLPIETSLYYRATSSMPVTKKSNHGIQSHLYFRIEEFDLSLTELLMDMLLYMVGKLDLAGPFAVKNSTVVANSCKVENELDVDLLCYFRDNQSTRVGRRQSAFLLRHLKEASEENSATILLENPGISSTSSVNVPLSRTRIFAWRTRIISQEDSHTFPGPFIVFNISKNAEEGVSLNISPLLRLHNNTGFPVELRIQRPETMETEFASVLLREGDTVDDCMAAFDATNLSGGPKKALLSLGVGNFVFSFRPQIKEESDSTKAFSVEWSENLKGGKAVRLSGVIDKLGYQVRKVLTSESWKHSFSTTSCSLRVKDTRVTQMHFLVQSIARDVPIMQPNDHRLSKNSSIALQEQKEIFLLPTVRVSNLLESDIDVLLSDAEISTSNGFQNINQASIQSGSTIDLYANPSVIFFNITLAMFGSSCKPVNCSQYLKKLNKKKDGIQFLDIDLEFYGAMYFACLRLIRGNMGMLEASVFTQYTLRNDTDFLLFCTAPHLKPLSRHEAQSLSIISPPHFGTLLPPKSTRSWFMKTSKACMNLLDDESPKSTLDLDALSGLAEIKFSKGQGSGNKYLVKFGISLGPLMSKTDIPARIVSFVPRFIVSNDSDEPIFVRQCFLEGDFEDAITINNKQKSALFFRVGTSDNRDITVFNKLLQKHKASEDDSSFFVQFNPNETMWGWSGPICVASLGRFFLKFKRNIFPIHESDLGRGENDIPWEYASVRVVEEGSSFVLHFHRPPDTSLPYRIENNLHDSSITYYQKDTFQPETLESGGRVSYVWDDLSRPHKLMVKINGSNMLREINLDKLRPWKSFFRVRKQRGLASQLSLETRSSDKRGTNIVQMNGIGMENFGYEVYVDGPTRVLRISHSPERSNVNSKYQSCKKIQFRISYVAVRLLEPSKQDLREDADPYDLSTYTPIIIGRLENICFASIIIGQRKYNQIRVESVNVDEKWVGAPFAAILRRHLKFNNYTNDPVLFVVFVLFPTTSTIRDVRYSSIILQPIDLNLDEATLMKIVPFWRTSLSSNTQSQQYYFDHFEIHPVKITANFLPEDSYSSYSSGQEALRSLLHSVIKIPTIKNLEVELNGVLVTHALVTTRELLLRCARHYSWYGMRAIYIAKGSPLLPPTFASVFDDLASSSLDVFFDPSSSLFNVRGLTLGTFKLISKCIENKGFSGTKRYFGDLSKTFKNAGSNILFAAVTEVSDSVLKGAESSGFNGMVIGFHHGILRLAMEPSLLGTAFLEGGPDRRIKLDRSPGIDEQYVEGYLQAMLDTVYKQEYLRVRVIDDQVILKNLPPNSSLINEIMERVKDFLVSKALLKGDFSTSSRPLRHLRGENEWRIGPTVLTLCQHLFVSFAIRSLRKQTDNTISKLKLKEKWARKNEASETSTSDRGTHKGKSIWRWGFGKFILSAMVAYIDGRLCRCIPNPVARRIVSGFLLSFLDNDSK